MSDLGLITPVLTAIRAGPLPADSRRDSPQLPPPAPNDDATVSAENSPAAVTGQPTSALSAGLALVIQNIEIADGAEPATAQFEPVNPVDRAIEEALDPPAARTGETNGPGPTPSPQQDGGDGNDASAAEDGEDGAVPQTREATGPDGLTEEERRIVAELQRVDAEIRRHEQAHAAVGGPYAGAPAYTTVRGPDGRLYAVGGEVQIDVSEIPGNPAATIRKLQVVRRAALAPTRPSAADRRVASIAQQGIAEARQELREQRLEEQLDVQETQSLSAERRAQLQPVDSPDDAAAVDLQNRINLGIPALVRTPGPFVSPSRILSVIA